MDRSNGLAASRTKKSLHRGDPYSALGQDHQVPTLEKAQQKLDHNVQHLDIQGQKQRLMRNKDMVFSTKNGLALQIRGPVNKNTTPDYLRTCNSNRHDSDRILENGNRRGPRGARGIQAESNACLLKQLDIPLATNSAVCRATQNLMNRSCPGLDQRLGRICNITNNGLSLCNIMIQWEAQTWASFNNLRAFSLQLLDQAPNDLSVAWAKTRNVRTVTNPFNTVVSLTLTRRISEKEGRHHFPKRFKVHRLR